jgi:hypothetical protein
MLDCNQDVRTTYLTALNNNISYNGVNVPIYGQTPFETTPQNYVVIGNIVETPDNNNQRFNNNVDVTIDIFSEQYRTNDLSIVDNISNQILNIMISNTSIPVFQTANFQIFPKERTLSNYSSLQKGDNYIARKIIIINNLVNQIS